MRDFSHAVLRQQGKRHLPPFVLKPPRYFEFESEKRPKIEDLAPGGRVGNHTKSKARLDAGSLSEVNVLASSFFKKASAVLKASRCSLVSLARWRSRRPCFSCRSTEAAQRHLPLCWHSSSDRSLPLTSLLGPPWRHE